MSESFIDIDVLEAKLGMTKSHIGRVLGLGHRYLYDRKNIELPETQAVFKILYTMPWILEIVENNFDPEIAQAILGREAYNLKIEEIKEKKRGEA